MRALSCLLLLVAALSLLGCGDPGSSAVSVRSHPAPAKGKFPSAEGKTLAEVLELGKHTGPKLVALPAAKVFNPGRNRYPFVVSEPNGAQIPEAEVALYLAKGQALDGPVTGPYPAAIETLQTKPRFRSRTTAEDPKMASAVYTAQLDFPGDGKWRAAVVIKHDGELAAMELPSIDVGAFSNVPRPGQRAPRIHTPTRSYVGGDRSKLTTRNPPDTLSEFDFARALGQEPVILLFASPRFCRGRICGPVVDVAEQVSHELAADAYFIHMEIYKGNDPSKGVVPQVRAFHLPGEPWLFGVRRDGTIESVVEGPFGVEELTRLVKRLSGS